MIGLSMSEAADAVGGVLTGASSSFNGVSTDTRTLEAGTLFVALKGLRFDGHDSLAEAVSRGCAGVVVERDCALNVPVIRVDDTRLALGRLARAWRRRHPIPVVGVTGSNGKTSTKEMLAAILRRHGAVLATRGNLNNHIGVPLTLFGLSSTHRAAVVEMGANGMRDIADLVDIAEPTIALVTMCGPAHLEGFGSIENVAAAKGEIYRKLGPAGVAVINADDRFCGFWKKLSTAGRTLTFGLENEADFCAANIRHGMPGTGSNFELTTPVGTIDVALPLDGRHNVYNALAAAAGAHAAGATLDDIAAGLRGVARVAGRLNVRNGRAGSLVIDDTYNANPSSLAAALDVLRQCPQRRWLILGDMGELGADEVAAHSAAGTLARERGVERLFTVGKLSAHATASFGQGAAHYPDHEELLRAVLTMLAPDIAVLVKGSRFMQLDRVVLELVTEDGAC